MIDRVHLELTDEDIGKISHAYHAWRGDENAVGYEDVPGFCRSVKLEEIRQRGHVLTPPRYVGREPTEG